MKKLLKYFKDDYKDGRNPVDTGLLQLIMKEALKLGGVGNISAEVSHDVAILFLSGLNYYFYLHPEQYIDFGKFVGYRSIDLKNLWTIETKDGENAESIYAYYKNGGLSIDAMQRLVRAYSENLFETSLADQAEADMKVQMLESLTRHSEDE